MGIVGASSLVGKELAEVLAESSLSVSDVVLLDGEELAGQVTAAGDEVAVIQPLTAGSFDGMDFAYFTGDAALTRAHWQTARQAGASIVDLTGALAGEAPVAAPWVEAALGRALSLDLGTTALVAAHPASVMLALVAARLAAKLPVASVAATVLEPASEHGKLAMDELHQQTVSLLSFLALPKEQYDAQVAFNLLPSLGAEAKIHPEATERRILSDYARLAAGRLPRLTVQLAQAPVFHGYVASVLVELERTATAEELEAALAFAPLDVVGEGSDPPSNLSAAGQEAVLVRVRAASDEEAGTRFWVWMAADNLRLAALNAVACGMELGKLRPRGKVQ
jgi:aspartate-semialdehyde dehydrogenase